MAHHLTVLSAIFCTSSCISHWAFFGAFFSSWSLFHLRTTHTGLNLSGFYTVYNIHTHAPTNVVLSLCFAKHFGINPILWHYFLLFFFPILVLSFCYNRIFLMGGISISLHCSSKLLSFCVCCSHLIMLLWRSPHDSPLSDSLSGLITAERLQCKR